MDDTFPGMTHLDAAGRARMVDIKGKAATHRRALAEAVVELGPAFARWNEGTLAKGDAVAVARVAGIQAAKRTWELIPLAHPIPLTAVQVDFESRPTERAVRVLATAETVASTGVEMEAMTAASVAALTVYDMVKGIHRGVVIRRVRLLEKDGGKSGPYRADDPGV